jgi:hypothetical protein
MYPYIPNEIYVACVTGRRSQYKKWEKLDFYLQQMNIQFSA